MRGRRRSPAVPTKPRLVGTYLSPEVIAQLDAVAIALDVTRSDALRIAISDLVDAHADRLVVPPDSQEQLFDLTG